MDLYRPLSANTRLLILAGGQSAEHDISLISARSMRDALQDHRRLHADILVIGKDGALLTAADSQKALAKGSSQPSVSDTPLYELARLVADYDLVFPLIHGQNGEDGRIQGFLDVLQKPYIGTKTTSSALCFDKGYSDNIFNHHNIPCAPSVIINKHDTLHDLETKLNACKTTLTAPYFVKPCNQGSSIGIIKVEDDTQLQAAILQAQTYDPRIIVQSSIENAHELEVAVLDHGNDPQASCVGEITYQSTFYDLKCKYTDGMASLHIPTSLPHSLTEHIRTLACRVFRLMDCKDYARVDFFYDQKSSCIYLNELNTIPGFTPYSMYPKLWEYSGLPYADLIETLSAINL